MTITTPVCVVGGGTMARAIVFGALDAGRIAPEAVYLAEPDEQKRGAFAARGVQVHGRAPEALDAMGSGQILLAIKPDVFPDVARELVGRLGGERVVMSIMAGITSDAIARALGAGTRVVRVMPNTPAQIGMGITAIAKGADAREGDDALALALFASVGELAPIDEGLMDVFTAVAGSGPAYLFYLAEAMVRAAVEIGVEPAQADRIVRATIRGSAALLHEREDAPEDLRAAVTSKGGTTAAAISVLDDAKVIDAFVRAIKVARNRGRELGSRAEARRDEHSS